MKIVMNNMIMKWMINISNDSNEILMTMMMCNENDDDSNEMKRNEE